MSIQWKAARTGCLDGMSAIFLMFRRVRVPGSALGELNQLTEPAVLEKYRAVNPDVAAAILRAKDEALAHDRIYNRLIRVVGSIELAATVLAAWYVAAHYRF